MLYIYYQNSTKNDYVGTECSLLCAPAYNTQSRTIELHQSMKVLTLYMIQNISGNSQGTMPQNIV